MDLCPTLDMIRDYFTKALKCLNFFHFCNIVLGIHEDAITSYNTSRSAFIEEKKIKLQRDKEETQKVEKSAGD